MTVCKQMPILLTAKTDGRHPQNVPGAMALLQAYLVHTVGAHLARNGRGPKGARPQLSNNDTNLRDDVNDFNHTMSKLESLAVTGLAAHVHEMPTFPKWHLFLSAPPTNAHMHSECGGVGGGSDTTHRQPMM